MTKQERAFAEGAGHWLYEPPAKRDPKRAAGQPTTCSTGEDSPAYEHAFHRAEGRLGTATVSAAAPVANGA